MTAHASDWSDSLNRHHRGGKQNTMVMMFVGGVVLMLDRIRILFLLQKSCGAVLFCSRPNPYSGKAVNTRIVRRPYPIPKISTTLQELDGFTYAMALDLSMGYYTIRLDPKAVEMFTIIFPWGKYSYLRLPMGFVGSADIFQAEMMDLMEALEYVRAYIDDLLAITRGTLEDHLDKLREVLRRLPYPMRG
jgi:hypothetical protein